MKSVSVKNSEDIRTSFLTNRSSKTELLNSYNLKRTSSILLKILLNFLQLMAIIQTLEIKWPLISKDYFNFFGNAGVSSQAITMDCFLNDFNIEFESLYIQTIFGIILPFFTILIVQIQLILRRFVGTKQWLNKKSKFIVIIVSSCIYLQPNILKFLYANIIFKEINGELYLKENLRVLCFSEERKNWFDKIFKF